MMRPINRSFLTRLLLTTALPLALMTAGAAGVRAATVIVPTVAGSMDGANGVNGVNPGDPGQPGGPGQPASADAGHLMPNSDPLNSATATGGNGGAGGNGAGSGIGGAGGAGGGATATATTTVISGPAEADAFSNGGRGGAGGFVSPGAAGGWVETPPQPVRRRPAGRASCHRPPPRPAEKAARTTMTASRPGAPPWRLVRPGTQAAP